MLKNVVLPAPFGPIRLTIAPSGTVKSTSSTATRPPNSFRSICVSSSALCTRDLRVVERLVVDAFVQLRRDPRARDQPLRPEEHDDHNDRAEDPELVLRDGDVRVEMRVDLRADVREALAVRSEERRVGKE